MDKKIKSIGYILLSVGIGVFCIFFYMNLVI